MILVMTFIIILIMLLSEPKISAAPARMPVSIRSVTSLAETKVPISYHRVFASNDLLRNTQSLFVINAKITAKTHEMTFEIIIFISPFMPMLLKSVINSQ